MEIVGKTRLGNLIYIDYKIDPDGRRIAFYPLYDQVIEYFDAWVVFGFICIRFIRKDLRRRTERYFQAERHFENIWKANSGEIPPQEMSINSRQTLARQLVRPEYLD